MANRRLNIVPCADGVYVLTYDNVPIHDWNLSQDEIDELIQHILEWKGFDELTRRIEDWLSVHTDSLPS